MKNRFINSRQTILRDSWVLYFSVFERHTISNKHYLIHSCKNELDQSGFVCTILMGVLKAYDCMPHDLLIAKLECYEVDKIGLSLLLDYLSRSRLRTKICSSYIFWYDIVRGVPHALIFGPLIFNLFFVITMSELCNFADNNTLNSSNKKLE